MYEEVTLSSERIYDGRVVHLRVDTVRLPDGKQTKREIVEHSGAVGIVAVDDEDNVLLVKQYRKPVEQELYEIPAGTLENGEEPEKCAYRELQEETGYQAGSMRRVGVHYSTPGFCTERIVMFIATDLQPCAEELATDADEFIMLERVPFTQALDMVRSGQIVDGKSIIGLLMMADRRRSV